MCNQSTNWVNSIVGWQYPESTIRETLAILEPRMLTMDFDFPCSKVCNLKCQYCFVGTDEREVETNERDESPKLTIAQLKERLYGVSRTGL